MNSSEVYLKKLRGIAGFDLRPRPHDERIDALMEKYLQRLRLSLPKHRRATGRVPGAAIVVRKGNELIHLKGYGCANLETGEQITPETVFDLGSVSKQFTAFAALSIFAASELDTPISKYLRGFPRYADKITIKHLIHHTSALPDYIDLQVAARRAAEDWYARVMRRRDNWYPQMPRRKKAPEVLHHAKCYNAVKDKGFVPVGYSPMNFVYGDGNIHSTIVDMAKWDHYLTALDRKTICESRAEGEKPAVDARSILWLPAKLQHQKQAEYGAGWNLLRNKYKDRVKENGRSVTKTFASRAEYHRGEWLGWRNYIARAQKWMLPAEGEPVDPETWESMGIVVLTNNTVLATHKEFYACALAKQIARFCWGNFKEDNIINCVDCALA